MSRPAIQPTGKERMLGENELIVSKTDTRGIITYCNRIFLDIADYTLNEVIDQPHNLVRNPLMPRCVFKLMWDRLGAGHEIFAYVVNLTKFGDHYWVYAHVTPSFDTSGKIVGYHSNRRAPRKDALAVMEPMYKNLCATESASASPKEGLAASEAILSGFLKDKGVDYDRFIHAL